MAGNPSSDPVFGVLTQDVSRLMRRAFNRRVQDLGLTQTQWRALAQLWRNEGIKQGTLADILEVQPITLARLIDRMETAGWVERRPHPDDRRAVQLYLTEKAGPVLTELRQRADLMHREALAALDSDEQAHLVEMLTRVKHTLVANEARADSPVPVEGAAHD